MKVSGKIDKASVDTKFSTGAIRSPDRLCTWRIKHRKKKTLNVTVRYEHSATKFSFENPMASARLIMKNVM